jgi:hypothetical protein
MSTFITVIVTSPAVAFGVATLQTWLEAWDYNRHLSD